MTEAGLTLACAWCDKYRGRSLLDVGAGCAAASGLAGLLGKGVISTLKADAGTCASRRVFTTSGGNAELVRRAWRALVGMTNAFSAWAGSALARFQLKATIKPVKLVKTVGNRWRTVQVNVIREV